MKPVPIKPFPSLEKTGTWMASRRCSPTSIVRGGTAKLLTLFRPATGAVRAKGVLSTPNGVLHPWLQDQLQAILMPLEKNPLKVSVPLPEDHPLVLTWQHWWWSYERPKPAPVLRLILVWDAPFGASLLQHGSVAAATRDLAALHAALGLVAQYG